MLFKKDELRLLWPYYAYLGITNLFAFIWAFWVIYLQERFSLAMIALALVLFSLSSLVWGVPLGALADVFGRKWMMVVGEALTATFFLLIPFVHSSSLFLVLLAFWGVALAMRTEAEEAWIVDYLKVERRANLIPEFYVKNEFLSNFSLIFASFFSVLIVKYLSMDYLWLFNGGAILLGILFLARQKEYFKKKVGFVSGLRQGLKNVGQGISFSLKNKVVFSLLMAIAFISIGVEIAYLGWQPLLVEKGVPVHYLGYLAALGLGIAAVVPFTVQYLVRKVKHEKYFLSSLSFLLSLLLILLVSILSPLFAIFVFLFRYARFAFHEPVFNPYYQKFVPSRIRATMGAFRSMVISLAFLLGDLLTSLFVGVLGLQKMMVLAGILTLPAVYFFLKINDHEVKDMHSDTREADFEIEETL